MLPDPDQRPTRTAKATDNARAPGPAGSSLTGGVSVITAAKVWFVIAGYALYFGLTRMLGPEDFGVYAVAISIVSVLNNVLIAASLQTVSRFVARDSDCSGTILIKALRIQFFVGAGLMSLILVAAPWIASWFRDPLLITPLRISSGIVFSYSLYAANVGFLNGQRKFTKQAALDATFSTLKTGAILSAVAMGLGVAGATSGFVLAAVSILLISTIMIGREDRPRGEFSSREYLQFGGWLVLLTLVSNLVLSADLWVVKRLADPAVSNVEAGLYRASLTLSQLLYQLLIPLILVVFPSIARLGSAADPDEARKILKSSFRYLTVVLIPSATVLALVGPDLVALLYGPDYRVGGEWLIALAPAYALWTCTVLIATALGGAGRPQIGVVILTVSLIIQFMAGTVLYPHLGPLGAAIGSLAGMATGLLLGGQIVLRVFGSFPVLVGVLKGLGIAVPLGLVAGLWTVDGRMFLVKLAVLAAIGLASLVALGELPPGIRSRLPGILRGKQ